MGLEIGDWILSKAASIRAIFRHGQDEESIVGEGDREREPLLAHEEQLPGYRSTVGSPLSSPRIGTTATANEPREPLDLETSRPYVEELPQKKFSRAVLLNIVTFGILAL